MIELFILRHTGSDFDHFLGFAVNELKQEGQRCFSIAAYSRLGFRRETTGGRRAFCIIIKTFLTSVNRGNIVAEYAVAVDFDIRTRRSVQGTWT